MILLRTEADHEAIAYFHVTSLMMEAKIVAWVNANLDKLDLNEAYSCEASLHNNKIVVSGDEDLKELELVLLDNVAITL